MDRQIFIIVAAYNEADRIGVTLQALASAFPGARLLLADDGSSDDTASIAAGLGAQVVRSERMLGKGEAVTLAAREALGNARALQLEQEAVFVLCDGDLGSSAGALSVLADAVADGRGDLAVAAFSRRVGGGIGLALGFARWAIRRRCGLRTVAPISGQRALECRRARRRAALRARLRHGDWDDDRRRALRAPADRDRARSRAPRHRAHCRRLRPPRPPTARLRACVCAAGAPVGSPHR